jgi:hypothetical protein
MFYYTISVLDPGGRIKNKTASIEDVKNIKINTMVSYSKKDTDVDEMTHAFIIETAKGEDPEPRIATEIHMWEYMVKCMTAEEFIMNFTCEDLVNYTNLQDHIRNLSLEDIHSSATWNEFSQEITTE